MHHPHTTTVHDALAVDDDSELVAIASQDAPAAPSWAPIVRAYTGIGSRRTPPAILELMSTVAGRLAVDGWTLRSGGAPGADQAFQAGAAHAAGAIELYLPWPTFEARRLDLLGSIESSFAKPG